MSAALPRPTNWRTLFPARSRNQRSTGFCASPKQEVRLRRPGRQLGGQLDGHRVRERRTLPGRSRGGRLAPEVVLARGPERRAAFSSPQKSAPSAAGAASGAASSSSASGTSSVGAFFAVGVGPVVVPADEERDPLLVVDGPDLDRRRRRREVAAGLHDLADHREARRGGPVEERLAPRGVDVLVERRRHEERRVARGVAVAQRVDVVGEGPAIRLGHGVEERRHRGPVEAGAEGAEDVLPAGAAAERPAVGEVRGADRVAQVVLQGRRRGALAPPRLAVAAHAAERDVELLALRDRLLRGGGRRLAARWASGPGRGRRSPRGSP